MLRVVTLRWILSLLCLDFSLPILYLCPCRPALCCLLIGLVAISGPSVKKRASFYAGSEIPTSRIISQFPGCFQQKTNGSVFHILVMRYYYDKSRPLGNDSYIFPPRTNRLTPSLHLSHVLVSSGLFPRSDLISTLPACA